MPASLLGPNDPEPVSVQNAGGSSPYVFVSEHAGNYVPVALKNLGLSKGDINDHIGWDLHIQSVGGMLSNSLDAPYICQPYSRLLIDCNRPVASETSIPATADGRSVPGNRSLDQQARSQRQDEIFTPFHRAIEHILEQRHQRARETIFVTLHSFTPAMNTDDEARPWNISFQYGRDPRFSNLMMAVFKDHPDICVGDNVPYPVTDSTHYTIPEHGERRRLHHTMIELRQDVIASAKGQAFWANILMEKFYENASKI
jgi:predicted N-formylglutamate amidohydrolase